MCFASLELIAHRFVHVGTLIIGVGFMQTYYFILYALCWCCMKPYDHHIGTAQLGLTPRCSLWSESWMALIFVCCVGYIHFFFVVWRVWVVHLFLDECLGYALISSS